ncbi:MULTISPECIES: pantoate--beta-alanine ligase [Bacillaceae]|uniref:pantoate--beta-alanine ligase n=1 Tax=Bacillaceae TaxID=186817 RepID=UPI001C599FA2|nr:pantoate--beta-alanine ligase [Rossellomorea sp. YZS02]MBW3113292.1 pantoate--beta-alanine ligase [Bacillus sp. MCCB 382]MDX8345577.1 pantoate--beta-alanine ligase [Rossellomorea sp. YZS02]
MNVITSIGDLRLHIDHLKNTGTTIGFVPTMGFLHEGHLTLAKEARVNNEIVVMSIFVNPLQFGPNEDFDRYPRDVDRDTELARKAGVDILFIPEAADVYRGKQSVTMSVKERVDVLCGRKREGHFDGVVTVLTKLFHLVQPTRAYFGQKDAQQVAVVEGLVSEYFFPVEIVRVPTVREEDGLAKSSRNVYLSPKERVEAPFLYRSLKAARKSIEDGERNPSVITKKISDDIQGRTSGTIDYVEVYSYPELEELERLEGDIIIALAVQFQQARLIDNIIISVDSEEDLNV